MSLGFNKKEKLCNKALFQEIVDNGQALTEYPVKLVYVKTEFKDNTIAQVAFAVPKRKFKRAVDRNRVKRLMREAYRLNKNILVESDTTGYAILFIYLRHTLPDFKSINLRTQKLLNKLIAQETATQ